MIFDIVSEYSGNRLLANRILHEFSLLIREFALYKLSTIQNALHLHEKSC